MAAKKKVVKNKTAKLSKGSANSQNNLASPKGKTKEAKAKRDMVNRKMDKKTGATKATSDKVTNKDTGKTEDKKKKASVKKRAAATKKDLKKVQTARKADASAAAKKKAADAAKKKATKKVAAKVASKAIPGVGAALTALEAASYLSDAPKNRKSKGGQMSRKKKK